VAAVTIEEGLALENSQVHLGLRFRVVTITMIFKLDELPAPAVFLIFDYVRNK
jgi:hypothetical protein